MTKQVSYRMKIYADFNFIVLALNGQKPEFLFLNSIHIKLS